MHLSSSWLDRCHIGLKLVGKRAALMSEQIKATNQDVISLTDIKDAGCDPSTDALPKGDII